MSINVDIILDDGEVLTLIEVKKRNRDLDLHLTHSTIKVPSGFEIRPISVESSSPSAEIPAIGASILSYLYSPERLESLLGDLEEKCRDIAAKRGPKAARRRYFWEVIGCVFERSLRLLRILIWIREAFEKLGL